MEDYEYYYNNAKDRYYNACSEISSCQNRIYDLQSQKKATINKINQLKTKINNTKTALNGITQILKSEQNLQQKISVISDKTDQAATNYSSMAVASHVQIKNLTDVYSDQASKTKTNLNNILNSLKSKKTTLNNQLNNLQNQLKGANSDLEDINNQIRNTENNLQSWRNTQQNASYDMEYYRQKMQQSMI